MTVLHGFELIEQRRVDERKLEARLYRHVRTGAQLLSMVTDDENKVFGITFRTPPKDSTGVAHILEHSVLCGSTKYPVKEPFVELLKGSLKTFLNAFTFPDKTCYPVASQNLRDFYNLVDVYLDAVLHPRLTPDVLKQEGWHFELEGDEGPLTYQGVVYGEMKGVRSSPDSLLAEYTQQSMFPDNTYGLDSGGDPKEIPNLTFEAFEGFHSRYYHPSNARLYFYGDDDPEERLKIAAAYLDEYKKKEVDSAVALQSPFTEPRRLEKTYAASSGDDDKAMVTVNWLLPETRDVHLNLALHVLEYLLIGMPGSPLRKALIDSGLGEDLTGCGLETDLRQMYFSTGLKGVEPEKVPEVEKVIFDVLRQLSTDGIDKGLIEASINSIEFHTREANTGSYPRGLVYMIQALTTWLHDADPLLLLAFEQPLQEVKKVVMSPERFLERLIDKHFLSNQHRSTVVLLPDPSKAEADEAEERARLDAVASKMGAKDRKLVMKEAQTLKEKQQTPDSPEALESIPKLAVADLPRDNKKIPSEEFALANGAKLYFHDLNTVGIHYLDLAFDMSTLPAEELVLLPIFARALTETGTAKEDFVSLSQRISAKTGGVWADAFASSTSGSDDIQAWLLLRGKAMADKTAELTAIMADVLQSARIDDQSRIKQLILEEKAQQEQRLVPGGHGVVEARLRASFTRPDWVNEQMGGITYLFALRILAEQIDTQWPSIADRLQRIRELVVSRHGMRLNSTLDQASFTQARPHLEELVQSLPRRESMRQPWKQRLQPNHEGLTIPTQVNYVGKGANLYELGYQYHGSSIVISRFLRTSWLWDRIRVQGGAYGAFCRFDRLTGVFTYTSYRDPNVTRTIEAFDDAAKFLRELPLAQEEIDKSIIGAIGDLDTYMLPDAKGYVSFIRTLTRQSEEERARIRQQVFETSEKHFREFAQVLEAVRGSGRMVVLGSPEAIGKAAPELNLNIIRVK